MQPFSISHKFHRIYMFLTKIVFKLLKVSHCKALDYELAAMKEGEMNLRHEWKHEINYADAAALRSRLKAVAKIDEHAPGGSYEVRSLYFDNLQDKALREKLDGVDRREKINGVQKREKFRIRYYNKDTSLIHLEKKSKINGLTAKESVLLSRQEAGRIGERDYGWMAGCGKPLVEELYRKIRSQGLMPRTIVDYTREPFVYGPGNVRVTLDYHLRTGIGASGFLGPHCQTIPAGGSLVILEVKWDAFLPDIIRDAVQLPGRRACAFSKYAACRAYG